MAKKVWFINQYITSPSLCGQTHRHFALANHLKHNNSVTLFTGSYSHIHQNISNNEVNDENGIKIINLKILKYSSSIFRILNLFHFALKLRFFNYKKLEKPDVIVISTMSLFPLLLIKFFKKKFEDVKIVHEIRDIWPLTPLELAGYSKSHPFIKLLSYCEKLGYNNADFFVSNLANAHNHVYQVVPHRKHIPFEWISNGFDESGSQEELSIKVENNIPKSKFLIGYAGTIGKANCMEVVVRAFNSLQNSNLHLCLIGYGDQEGYLKSISGSNITFLGKIPKPQVQSFLEKMDACILSWKKIELYKFGISPNKLFDYLNASKPVIMCADIENTIIHKSNCGWVVPAEDADTLSKVLYSVSNMENSELEKYGERGYDYLKNNFLFKQLAEKYQKAVIDVL
ncbi:hypothetical protein BTO05_08530 [Winogradskyella sp. PC-19]|uniref:glycosyltransferase family 4 protein n=1 Tax=Winogradskyella sp. PC-19 TaxID=754417 RepID=UPI000B3C8764|nr:glycosyltransferase family 4 protein [Winogradskyella sp. PC-19]ARV09685.1 hypothetical protein BTO05_08530 [Winogradskyella sp. PC-19]